VPTSATASIRTTTTNANLLQDIYLAKRFVETLRKSLSALEYADEELIPEHSGKNVRWQYFANPPAATSPLSEGADPADSRALTTTKIEGTIAQYGDYFELADLFEDAAVSGTKQAFVDAAAYQARLTLDTLTHTQALDATTSSTDAGTSMSAKYINKASLKLRQHNAKPHPKSPGGTTFIALLSPEQADDMSGEGSPAWWQVKTAQNQQYMETPNGPVSPDRVTGKTGQPDFAESTIHNATVRVSTNVTADSSTPINDLGSLISYNSFGCSSLGDFGIMEPKVMIVPAVASLASPLAMRGTVGWKVNFVAKLFDSNRVEQLISDQS
jgi:N4-gp56 family major capsid protein